jgi:hypothetical protein
MDGLLACALLGALIGVVVVPICIAIAMATGNARWKEGRGGLGLLGRQWPRSSMAPPAGAAPAPPAPGRAAPGARLAVLEAGRSSAITVADGQMLLVGRDADANLRVSDPQVGGHHALISRSAGAWIVRDLGETPPTCLVGALGEAQPVRGEIRLASGQITMGNVLVTLFPGPSRGAESPVDAAPAAPAPAAPAQAAAPAPAPAQVWAPTHLVPAGGMPTWDAPDPSRPPLGLLPERLELVLEANAGDWAQVRLVSGWRGWVDGRLLVRRP